MIDRESLGRPNEQAFFGAFFQKITAALLPPFARSVDFADTTRDAAQAA
jgi:hypothetical protein